MVVVLVLTRNVVRIKLAYIDHLASARPYGHATLPPWLGSRELSRPADGTRGSKSLSRRIEEANLEGREASMLRTTFAER